jgi:hypothetical protein
LGDVPADAGKLESIIVLQNVVLIGQSRVWPNFYSSFHLFVMLQD